MTENIINEIPPDLLKLTISHYVFSTINGQVKLEVPSSMKKKEVKGVRAMFDLIFEQMEENSYE